MVIFRHLPDLPIGYVEIMFPGQAVAGFFPAGCDEITILIEFPLKSLREAGGIPPDLPDTIRETHLIHS